jgi:hypothetical protein
MPLATEPGEAFGVFVEPRVDAASGKPHEIDYNQGRGRSGHRRDPGPQVLGRSLARPPGLLPFLYRLHYSMHLPAIGAYDTGMLLMGIIAIAWVFDTWSPSGSPSRAWPRGADRSRSAGARAATSSCSTCIDRAACGCSCWC